ncbi:MAG TPA: hypothetical protein DCL54_03930 [Alphaproteobacteria bacterium]|nr:hypothetical protein [Alphaproteobacteria bacterium]HAJ45714.1 hypothetical protein [Alphaproteobacteria bacterium]
MTRETLKHALAILALGVMAGCGEQDCPQHIVYIDTRMPDAVAVNYSIGVICVLDQYRAGERLFFNCDKECEAASPGESGAAACEAGRLIGAAWVAEGFAP